MNNDQRIAEIEARCEAATPGPWEATLGHDCRAFIKTQNEDSDFKLYNHADADFIANAREDIPFLLSRLAAKDAEIKALREANRKIAEQNRRLIWRMWTPITEESLPPKGDCLVALADGRVVPAHVMFPEDFKHCTHWMPLPAPPEEGAEHE